MGSRLSILHPPGRLGPTANPFGKDVANRELFRALALHGGFAQIDLLSYGQLSTDDVRADMGPDAVAATRLEGGGLFNQKIPGAAGALFFGQPYLADLAWLRRRAMGDRAYSLVGLVHTLAPLMVRQLISQSLAAPVHPWDAIICTSPSVRDALGEMMGQWGDFLGERTGGRAPQGPQLPLVPLGVDGARMAALADRPEARASRRDSLGIGADDILVLWVGRLSYFEKAFPQPMFAAVQQAAAATGVKVHFVLSGWFPEADDARKFRAAAQSYAPDVAVRFVDGNDRTELGELWAAADVFLSLVDNIQETFGITPLEAMAAGLPVVASDWDGYRFTMRDGVEAFLIPTLGGPQGSLGDSIVFRHALGVDSYQAYAGTVAQHTAVHIGRAAEALAALIRSPELRRRMGQAGRARVADAFDWPIIARQIRSLVDELGAIRAAAPEVVSRHSANPVKSDPFAAFAGFATSTLAPDTPLRVPAGRGAHDLARSGALALDQAYSVWRATPEECARALALVQAGQAATVRDLLLAFPHDRRQTMAMAVNWMAKLGMLDWLDQP